MQRTPVPNWASEEKPEAAKLQSQSGLLGGEPKASGAQLEYIRGLIRGKDLSSLSARQQNYLRGLTELQLTEATTTFTRNDASRIITPLKQLPWLPREQQGAQTPKMPGPFVPAGRYAVDSNEGELRFYQVWRPKGEDHERVYRVYVLHGPDSSPVHRNAEAAIIQKIYGEDGKGIREAAIRFGNEIGACSNCGRRLTNRISRELGIGPVCGGRMFGDDFKYEIQDAKSRLRDRGLDPMEEIAD